MKYDHMSVEQLEARRAELRAERQEEGSDYMEIDMELLDVEIALNGVIEEEGDFYDEQYGDDWTGSEWTGGMVG